MIDMIRDVFGPYYVYVKFIHMFFMMIWVWSTSVAYIWYVKVAWLSWAKNPQDEMRLARRNWVFEQFDRGVVLEHTAFPIVIVTGVLLLVLSGWPLSTPWVALKLAIFLLVFMPVEVFDYWLCHYAGNKNVLKKHNDPQEYERFMHIHWRFLRISTPLIAVFVPLILFLAIVKPF